LTFIQLLYKYINAVSNLQVWPASIYSLGMSMVYVMYISIKIYDRVITGTLIINT